MTQINDIKSDLNGDALYKIKDVYLVTIKQIKPASVCKKKSECVRKEILKIEKIFN